jgi:hypothetical protein
LPAYFVQAGSPEERIAVRVAVLLLGTALAVTGVFSITAAQSPREQQLAFVLENDFKSEPLTPFETRLVRQARLGGAVYENVTRAPADHNARGLILTGGDAAVVDFSVTGRKYGVSLDGTDDVLIKNFTFVDRRSNDRFGSGLILGQSKGTQGETWLSNAWIDLMEPGPEPDYQKANNEAISVERNNEPLNVRRAVLIGAGESGLDNKGHVRMDASFIAAGHRPVRIWNGASLVLVNSTVLALPRFGGFWFGGGEGVARLEYYNCRFGRVGDRAEELSSEVPDWMISKDEDDPVNVRIRRLDHDPLDRSPDSFWVRTRTPVPSGYLTGRG